MNIGYAYLLDHLNTGAFELPITAQVKPVSRVMAPADRQRDSVLMVPPQVAPSTRAPIDHLLFALKHEGLEMQQALLALKKIDGQQMDAAIQRSPNSEYVRKAAYLWELANPNSAPLHSRVAPTAPYQLLLDPQEHCTARAQRGEAETKWRIDFNGLGTRTYCPTVRRTKRLDKLLASDIVGRAKAFTSTLDAPQLERILSWAYLSETRGSDQLEREATSHDKQRRFAQLLSTAASSQRFSEDALAAIQRAAISNPALHAFGYRNRQNWLSNALRGPAGVSYVPPAAEQCAHIMGQIEIVANRYQGNDGDQIDPLVAAALVSFAVVLAHPFMDGNGRVHRYLFHAQLCSRARLDRGLILPISVAMGRHADRYLAALESFSRPARQLWDVTRPDEDVVSCTFIGDELVYSYWDATECVTFGLEMAESALDQDLLLEHQYLKRHDTAAAALGRSVDMPSGDLHQLVRQVLQHGSMSNNVRKRFVAKGYSNDLLDEAQRLIVEADAETVDASSPETNRPVAPSNARG